jgi:C2 domain
MPSLVKIKILQAHDLPGNRQCNHGISALIKSFPNSIRENLGGEDGSADAYVEIRLDELSQKTKTYRKSLNPVWNEEFRFEVVDDSCLQNSPVEFKVLPTPCSSIYHCPPP